MAGEMWFDWNREIRTAEDWDTCGMPVRLEGLIDEKPQSRRKLFLFGAACCRRVWDLYDDIYFRDCISIIEDYADGRAPRKTLDAYCRVVSKRHEARCNECGEHEYSNEAWHRANIALISTACWRNMQRNCLMGELGYASSLVPDAIASSLTHQARGEVWLSAQLAEFKHLANLFRDVMGNPFRPDRFLPKWRTTHVLGIARQMYDARAFGNMPILADALEDAGCDEPAILDHCREPREHVRGCWVVDLALGPEEPPVLHPTK